MTQQVLSRTQRRMEKKQTLFMVSMLLVVGLVCFFLGVMVGRSGEQSLVAEEHLPAKQPLVAVQDEVPGSEVEEGVVDPSTTEKAKKPQLTFYDTLPEGQQNALGSGINLPPEPKKSEPAPEPIKSAPAKNAEPVKAVASVKPSTVSAELTSPKPATRQTGASKPAVSKPTAVAGGDYIVQVASVKQRQGANGLRDRMTKKGYAAFVEAADLGAKGVWYRVYAGPYSNRTDADRAVSSLKADRISSAPLVKRR